MDGDIVGRLRDNAAAAEREGQIAWADVLIDASVSVAQFREAICAIYEAREAEDFDGLMAAIDRAFAIAANSALEP